MKVPRNPPSRPLLIIGLIVAASIGGCDPEDGGPAGAAQCEACQATSQCQAPLRCQSGLCVVPGGAAGCNSGGEGEGEGEGEDEAQAPPVTCDDAGAPPAAGWRLDDGALCDSLKPSLPPAAPPAAGPPNGRYEFHGGEPGCGGGAAADGARLCNVIGEVAPPEGGSTGPPEIQLFPRSGTFVDRLGVRACISDPDGIKDLACDSVTVSLDGVDLTADMIWGWTLPDRVCGQVRNGTFERGWRSPAGDSSTARASVAD